MNRTMKTRWLMVAVCGLTGALAQAADEKQLLSLDNMRETVAVQDLRVEGTTVTGTIVNNTSHRIENPQLLVRHNWIWKNEYRPGPDNPGWVDFAMIDKRIESHQSAQFSIQASRPAPERDDGHIVTWADVSEVTAAK